jgi:hypothetical protein
MEKPGKTAPKPQRNAADIREERLKAALKANMARRKAQARVRAKAGAGVDPQSSAENNKNE